HRGVPSANLPWRRLRGAICRPVAEVSVKEEAPRPQGAVRLDGRRPETTRRHGRPVGARPNLLGRFVLGDTPVAKLPVRVVTPGPQGAIRLDGHGVGIAG